MTKFCKHCNEPHLLTTDYWYSVAVKPQCKLRVLTSIKSNYVKKRESKLAYAATYRKVNAKMLREKDKKRFINPDRKEAMRRYKKSPKSRIAANRWMQTRIQSDMDFRIACRLRTRMWHALKGTSKTGSAIRDLGCSVQELRKYLQEQFKSGMTWENYGNSWEIDHILPLANYKLSDRGTYRRLVHYTNLQPMWIVENRSKSNKEMGRCQIMTQPHPPEKAIIKGTYGF